jgi:hypothetical protein
MAETCVRYCKTTELVNESTIDKDKSMASCSTNGESLKKRHSFLEYAVTSIKHADELGWYRSQSNLEKEKRSLWCFHFMLPRAVPSPISICIYRQIEAGYGFSYLLHMLDKLFDCDNVTKPEIVVLRLSTDCVPVICAVTCRSLLLEDASIEQISHTEFSLRKSICSTTSRLN